jgi:hypothetical protein
MSTKIAINRLTASDAGRHIIVLYKTTNCPKQLKTWVSNFQADWDWIFLSDDYVDLKRWKEGLGDSFSYIPIYEDLTKSAQILKHPYLQFLALLGHDHPEPAWWASRISERNTALSPLFENICRLDSLKKILKKSNRPVLIVSDSNALLKIIQRADWLSGRKIYKPSFTNIKSFLSLKTIKRHLLDSKFTSLAMIVVRVFELAVQCIQSKIASQGYSENNIKDAVLIHTYIDETNFSKDNIFRDRYFPGLEIFLNDNGFQVIVLPVMFNLNRSFYSAWLWAKSSPTNFINPFKFYRLVDYIYAIRTAFRAIHLPTRLVSFRGDDLSSLFKAEAARTSFDSLLEILYLRLPLRLKQNGINCLAVIAEFENMIPEKMLIQGFREHQRNAELIGFQHSAVYPLLLCQYTPVEERDIAPMYDRIVCNGHKFREILVSEGLAPDIAFVGAALRYRHLTSRDDISFLPNESLSIDVFVPLPLMMPAGVELLDKLIASFGSEPGIRVMLKAHPMSTINALLSAAQIGALPPHFQITKSEMSTILPRTRVMVGLSTCTMFEAVAAGVPVVRLHRETAIDLDPLAFLGDFSPVVRSAVELLKTVKDLLNLSDAEKQNIQLAGREILSEAFHPCDKDGMNAFLPLNKPIRPLQASK